MTLGPHRALALTARVSYLDALQRGAHGLVQACMEGARLLANQSAEPALYARRRDLVLELPRAVPAWASALEARLQQAARDLRVGRSVAARAPGLDAIDIPLTLVDDLVVERDLAASRLAQAVADLTGSEYTDLNARLQAVGGAVESGGQQVDVLSVNWLARSVVDSWQDAQLSGEHWQTLQTVLQNEVAQWAQEAYHVANKALLEQGVRPEIDLRPFIRRARDAGTALTRPGEVEEMSPRGLVAAAGARHTPGTVPGSNSGLQPLGRAHEETRLMTQTPGMARGQAHSQAMLGKLTALVARQVPGFVPTEAMSPMGSIGLVSPGLGQAIRQVSEVVRRQADTVPDGAVPSPQAVLQDLQHSQKALKEAAATPVERATIEIVALLFQSILQEERLPAAIRVWFARLQMPVLRVAVTEPDFFATTRHPARMLIDRMGSCVMGFVAGEHASEDALHDEIKRVVQVVEAYPDTGRRVFQTVLGEFERFLETYFRDQNQASRKGVSLAQQVEQRETWAIQYTIELRKMLEDVPVHEGVREFLFRVWADVLAHSAVQTGQASEATRELKRAAADLIWSASAKTSREERAEVLRRLPPLLKTVREGMVRAGLAADAQDAHIQALNTALAAAFSARSAPLSSAHLREVTQRLEALDELLPDMAAVELDADTLRDLSGHESENLEVVAEGGTMPTPAMLAWARELQIGSWFQLDYRGKREQVQLAWQGMNKQLSLFVTPQGRGVLFQLHRLGAFLQAGLLLPLEEESLTTRATRQALAKLDADPARLLN
ncbi:MAG: DUF1631 family protein [Proteobacteria bacterium]|uniref:DUF1631 family protein n=1 Tax=Aquabacterium sp. TaxID=1872578 RepID=UPI0035C76D85|nr:DUF1631 family protein [Pseudomonadota bacterium]